MDSSPFGGTPGRGIHRHFMGIAWIDVLLTVLAAKVWSKYGGVPMSRTLPFLFLAGILTHRALGIRTAVDKALFPQTRA